MRKEVTLTDYNISTVLKEIRDFLLDVGVYTMHQNITTYSQPNRVPKLRNTYTYMVFYNRIYKMYVIFFGINNGYISMMATNEFDNDESIFWQKNLCTRGIMNEYDSDIYSSVGFTKNYYMLYPTPTLYKPNVLVMNYNSDHNTFMISAINKQNVRYQDFTDTTSYDCTTNMFFGDLDKWTDMSGGFYYGGDFICTYELVHRVRVHDVQGSLTYFCSYLYSQVYMVASADYKDLSWHSTIYNAWYTEGKPWIDYPENNYNCYMFSPAKPNYNSLFNVEVFLYGLVDNAPNRDKRTLLQNFGGKLLLGSSTDKKDSDIKDSDIKDLEQTNIWCTTLDMPYYTHMVTTLDINNAVKLPTYWPLYSKSVAEMGHDINTLNGITLVMPMYFMVKRDPQQLDNYSCVGISNVIRYVNMYNMATNHIKNGNYPVEVHKYNCFQTGIRRNMFGLLGYNGIAFRQEGDN